MGASSMIDLGLLAAAALLGALMSRLSLCTVATVQQCVQEWRLAPLLPLVVATGSAGIVLLALHVAAPATVLLPGQRAVGPALAIGALLLGIGALVNGACYLGSVLYLGRGNANFLFTLLGLGLAARLSRSLPPKPVELAPASGTQVVVGLAVFALAIALAIVLAARAARARQAPGAAARSAARNAAWAPAMAIGACAGVLYAMHPGWSYGALLESAAGPGHAMRDALLAAVLLFAGATVGSLVQHRWQFTAPSGLRALRCVAGGTLMGLGAHLVPGGNDMLLLWTIPGLAAYGLLAYALMVATLALPMLARTARR